MNQIKKYDLGSFRLVKHGAEDINASCRQCKWEANCLNTKNLNNVSKKAAEHCRQTLHTVDVYRENHTEYTCYVRPKIKKI